MKRLACLVSMTLTLPALALAAEENATVRKVLGKASSQVNTTLPEGSRFTTAPRSKAELGSRRGVVRVGEKADLDVTRGGGLTLRQGVTLIASNPGTFRRTIEVRAPGYRVRVRGTAQIAYEPGRTLKVVVLEGSLTMSLDSLSGEFEEIGPGQQLIINPSDNRLPEPVEIDLGRLVSTSQMVSGEFGALSTQPLIDASIAGQGAGLQRGDLAATPFFLTGLENDVQVRDRLAREQAAEAARPPDPRVVEQTIFRAINDLDDPRAVTRSRPFTFAGGTDTSTLGDFTFARNAENISRTRELNVTLNSNAGFDEATGAFLPPTAPPTITGFVRADPAFFSGTGRRLTFRTNTDEADAAAGFERLRLTPTADIESPPGVGLQFIGLGIEIEGARAQAGGATRAREPLLITQANGAIDITAGAELSGGSVAIQGGYTIEPAAPAQTITIDASKITARRRLAVGQSGIRTGIVIRNSSELLSLAENVELRAPDRSIAVDSSKLTAAKSLIIDSRGIRADASVVSLKNVQAMADIIRVRGFSPSGDALIIDGSTFEAAQLIRLYADGASTLRFRNAVNLKTPRADLAGKTIEVEPGGAVNITGKGFIFTDDKQYNVAGKGTIQAGRGLTEKPQGNFKDAPKF